jgi:threonylcarbamoyladenosine tRNA methylthiotransferase MtaB
VLIERPGDRGHTPNFAEIRCDALHVGSIQEVTITGMTDSLLHATARPALERAA